MKRLVISLVVVGAMLFASPVMAKKPIKPDPEPVACAFNTEGVLVDTVGKAVALGATNTSYRCELTAEHSGAYTFTIADPSGNVTSLLHPYVAIRDVYPIGANICFREMGIRRVTNPDDDGVFAEFSTPPDGIDTFENSNDGICGPNEADESETYAFTFQTGKAKGGTVQLTMTPRP
jgi:hypothetical protein